MKRTDLDDVFEPRISFPDPEAKNRLSQLVGLDEHRSTLRKVLSVQVHPQGLEQWAAKHHPAAQEALLRVARRPPLVVLAGDVGTGKTELASTIGDEVARSEGIDVTLFPLSLSTRGSGLVGEMTTLLSSAFTAFVNEAAKLKSENGQSRGAVILLVDEADAIGQSREEGQMHHEDRAGVNTFIRGVDRIANARLPAAVLMCTNRPSVLDPAIRRRAAATLVFERPNTDQRRAVLSASLTGLGLSPEEIEALVEATSEGPEGRPRFSYSDLTQRLIPEIVLDAYPSGPVDPKQAIARAQRMSPTPTFRDGSR